MPRWEPDARVRLVRAALELFVEHGYDETTVVQIAEQAGLTKSTFFRYFPDKRDILAAGQETLGQLLADGIAAAPPSATALQALRLGLERTGEAFTEDRRDIGPALHTVIAQSDELRERAAQKHTGLAATISAALQQRGVAEAQASVAAELGMLAFSRAYTEWSAPDNQSSYASVVAGALDDLVAAAQSL